MRILLSFVAAILLSVSLSACSSEPPQVKVTGTVLLNEKPYTVAKGGGVGIVFIGMAEDGKPFDTFATRMNSDDSSFTLEGKTGRGIPPGKYRISIQQMVPGGPPAITEMNERFGEKNSPIIVEITDGKTPLAIELGKSKAK